MNFTKDKPTEEGFYWCKPAFSNVAYLEHDNTIKEGKKSVAEIVTLSRMSMGTYLYARFVGHKLPHSLHSPVIKNTLWGEKITC
jgi:hypothetical protein